MPSRNDIHIYRIDANDYASLNNIKTTNMIILGGLIKVKGIITAEELLNSLKKTLPERHHHLIPMNEQSIHIGESLIQKIENGCI